MATTSSFSKGCFVFKPSSFVATKATRSPKKKRKISQIKVASDGCSSALFSNNDRTSGPIRLKNYQETWLTIKNKSQDIISESHENLLQEIKNFMLQNVTAPNSSIPTAVVALGVNLPDHNTFFTLLDSTLKWNLTPYIAMLNSKECPSLKHMVQKLVQKLISIEDEENSENSEEGKEQLKITSKKTLANLALWYSLRTTKKPIVIILQDLECFSCQQLQDFVLLCREYRSRNQLPILLIMGIATPMTLQQQLHHRTTVCLSTKSFQSPPSVTLLNDLIEKLFMQDSAFKIGPRLMQQLLDAFLYHDLSLNSFMHRIQLICMQHFITLPPSALCCSVSRVPPPPNRLLQEQVKNFTSEDLDLYRQLPSFMKFVENNRSKVNLLTDDKLFRQFLQKSIQELHEYSVEFAIHCKLAHCFSQGMPGPLFGKTLREVYVNFLAGNTSEDWSQFIRLLNVSSSVELQNRLERTIDVVKSIPNANSWTLSISSRLFLFLEELKRLDNEDEEVAKKDKNVFVAQGKKLDKFELKAQLQATAKQSRPVSKFDEIRSEIAAWMNTDFAAHLKPPSTIPFHEISYAGSQVSANWDIVPWIRRQIQPVPRVAISLALTDPASYFHCQCCVMDGEGSIPPSMPDVCIAYKLHTECGRLINLYDWMVSFNSVVMKENEDDQDEIKPVIQARFIRAVAQLQFLGLVQSSKKKTDHVARLTWGV